MHEGASDLQSLDHTAREAGYLFIGAIRQLEAFQQTLGALFALVLPNTKIFGMKQENLTGRQAAIQIVDLRHDPNAPFDRYRILRDIDAFDLRDSAAGNHPRG